MRDDVGFILNLPTHCVEPGTEQVLVEEVFKAYAECVPLLYLLDLRWGEVG